MCLLERHVLNLDLGQLGLEHLHFLLGLLLLVLRVQEFFHYPRYLIVLRRVFLFVILKLIAKLRSIRLDGRHLIHAVFVRLFKVLYLLLKTHVRLEALVFLFDSILHLLLMLLLLRFLLFAQLFQVRHIERDC